MILVIDNYDSFVYNLVQYVGAVTKDVRVVRNNELSVDEAVGLNPSALVVSPGPGRPETAGISVELIRAMLSRQIPTLGVCLGHQAIALACGAAVVRADRVMHGKTSQVRHNGSAIFDGVPSEFEAMRYHSLIVDGDSVPNEMRVIAATTDGEIMGLAATAAPLVGLQFHPESIGTPFGRKIVTNFVTGITG